MTAWMFVLAAGLNSCAGNLLLKKARLVSQEPGLVGMLNINASMTKMGRAYSSIWGEDLTDPFADIKTGTSLPMLLLSNRTTGCKEQHLKTSTYYRL